MSNSVGRWKTVVAGGCEEGRYVDEFVDRTVEVEVSWIAGTRKYHFDGRGSGEYGARFFHHGQSFGTVQTSVGERGRPASCEFIVHYALQRKLPPQLTKGE